MNILRRMMLHPLRSRHNPLTRIALGFTLFALAMGVGGVMLELHERGERLGELSMSSAADRKMIAELGKFVEGEVKLVEVTGKYAVVRSVGRMTYEVK